MLTFVDWIVTGSFLLIPAILGCMYCISARRSYEELAFGSRNLGILPIAFSTAIGFLIFSQNILNASAGVLYYTNSAQMLTTAVAALLALVMSMVVFVPVLQKLKLGSVFEYLELRFTSVVLRWLISFLFIIVSVILSAFMIKLCSAFLLDIFHVPTFVSILTIGLSAIVYATLGGLPLTIFYHSFLTLALLSAMTIITVKGTESSGGGFGGAFNSRIFKNQNFKFDFSVDPFSRSNDLNLLLGYGFSLTCLYGIHQSQFQKYCAVSSSSHRKVQLALGIAIIFAILLLTLLTVMTLSIVSAYCKSMESIELLDIETSQQESVITTNYEQFMTLLTYAIGQLKNHYGVQGLFIAATGSFVLGLLVSVVNSLGVITIEDFGRKVPALEQCSDSTWTHTLRGLTIFYGLLITGLAFIPIQLDSLIVVVMEIFLITVSVIGSAFLVGMFLPFANKYGTAIGVVVGLCLSVSYNVETHWAISSTFGWTKFSQDNSTKLNDFDVCSTNPNYTSPPHLHHRIDSDGWSLDLLRISGHLHPALGSIVTILVAIIFSTLSGGCCQFKKLNRDHFHPLLHICMTKRRESISSIESEQQSNRPLLFRNPLSSSHRNVDRVSEFPLAKGTSNFSLFHQRYETISLNEVPQ